MQWDKDSCADAGFLKIDLLGLGMLSAIERCVDEIARVRGEHVDLSRIALDDPEVFAAIQRAETTGVFQIESRAQMQMLPRTLPADLDDLTVQVALVRPGPIQGGAVHPYIERRKRLRADPGYQVPYEHPSLEPILRDTLGAIVFQDQVLEVSMALAGFSPGEAEGLRRVMSKRRSEEAMRAYRERFIDGAVARGVERDVAERVFDQVKGFSGFGFPKSHSVAFGLLAYQSTWLRVHYGPELLCALLNEQPMGFYPPDALAHEAQRRGFTVRPPEINASEVLCHAEPMAQAADPAVRIGLGYIDGAREQEIRALVTERERGGTYGSLPELASRSGAGRQTLERLAWSGACNTLVAGLGDLQGAERERAARRRALWEIGTLATARRRDAGEQLALPLDAAPAPALAPLNRWERVVADYESTGVTLGDHPMTLLRGELPAHAVTTAALDEIADSTPVTLAGLVVARQRPSTAKGVVFMLLEDETGQVNVVVLPPVYERHRLTVRTEPFVSIAGTLERREGTINIIARRIGGLDRPDLPRAEVRHIEPPAHRRPEPATSADEQELPAAAGAEGLRPAAAGGADLRAVAPTGHSWGRRGR
ncbi:MAG: OB-fold nucleic acid binding domain-containing protein [Solirubrobacterales bacterium]